MSRKLPGFRQRSRYSTLRYTSVRRIEAGLMVEQTLNLPVKQLTPGIPNREEKCRHLSIEVYDSC